MLVRVRDAVEAAQAAAAGADGVELALADATAPDLANATAVRSAFPGLLRLNLGESCLSSDALRLLNPLKADELAFAFEGAALPEGPATGRNRPKSPKAVAILAALPEGSDAIETLQAGVDAIMIDVGPAARLVDEVGVAALDAFAAACRARHLPFGLAGGLEAPDVARLLLLEPNVLAFDEGLRHRHDRNERLDPESLNAIRALIPREGRAAAARGAVTKVIDRVFVSDFAVSLAIGAYRAEYGARQRVRFSVIAEIVRDPAPPRDMRDVFSYDVIIETIRVLSERPHVTFVETLAEEVATALLAHAEVVAVTVKVEKLDVIPGAVGIEIVRRNTTA